MKIVLPREHGTWMMFIIPCMIGIFAGNPTMVHIPFVIGWFALYLSSTPLLQMIRKPKTKAMMLPWYLGYTIVAILFLTPVLWFHPYIGWVGVLLLPFLFITIFFIKNKNERNVLNDLSGITIFSLGGISAYVIGTGKFDGLSWMIPALVILYFFGSALYVKSLIRERSNPRFTQYSHLYHSALMVFPWLVGMGWLSVAYIPSIMKDWLTTRKKALKPLTIGMNEILHSLIFLGIVLILIK